MRPISCAVLIPSPNSNQPSRCFSRRSFYSLNHSSAVSSARHIIPSELLQGSSSQKPPIVPPYSTLPLQTECHGALLAQPYLCIAGHTPGIQICDRIFDSRTVSELLLVWLQRCLAFHNTVAEDSMEVEHTCYLCSQWTMSWNNLNNKNYNMKVIGNPHLGNRMLKRKIL